MYEQVHPNPYFRIKLAPAPDFDYDDLKLCVLFFYKSCDFLNSPFLTIQLIILFIK